jgi:hypothetical protein
MTEELEQLLKNLKLRQILNIYDEQLRAAESAQTSYTEFVAGLFRAQWHERQESALEWRIRPANLPERWVAGDLPLGSAAGREPQTDPGLCRTRLCCQARELLC